MLIQTASALCLVASLATPAEQERPCHAVKARRHFIMDMFGGIPISLRGAVSF